MDEWCHKDVTQIGIFNCFTFNSSNVRLILKADGSGESNKRQLTAKSGHFVPNKIPHRSGLLQVTDVAINKETHLMILIGGKINNRNSEYN